MCLHTNELMSHLLRQNVQMILSEAGNPGPGKIPIECVSTSAADVSQGIDMEIPDSFADWTYSEYQIYSAWNGDSPDLRNMLSESGHFTQDHGGFYCLKITVFPC